VSFPLPFVSEDAGFRGAVFADVGQIFGSDLAPALDFGGTFADTTLRSSVGASIIWSSPIGVLRVDFAKVLSSAPYDVPQVIRFSVGTQF
jgi:outer membrane protein insertion porin family